MINVEIDEQQLIDLRETIGDIKGAFETVFSRGINSALTATRKEAGGRILDETTLEKDRVMKGITLSRAKIRDLTGKVVCEKRGIGLIAYGAKKVLEGIEVSTFRKSSPRIIRHTFIATAVGNQHVFGRKKIFKRPYKPWFPYRDLPKDWRYPLKRYAGPSVYGLFTMIKILQPVVIYGGDILADRVSKAFYRYALKHPESYIDEFLDDYLDFA